MLIYFTSWELVCFNLSSDVFFKSVFFRLKRLLQENYFQEKFAIVDHVYKAGNLKIYSVQVCLRTIDTYKCFLDIGNNFFFFGQVAHDGSCQDQKWHLKFFRSGSGLSLGES